MDKSISLKHLTQYAVLTVVAIIMFFPIIWIISSSFKDLIGISAYPPELLPKHPTLDNYIQAFVRGNIPVFFSNTMILIIGNTVGTLISSSIVAFPLARMNFKGKNVIFGMILATMMVPTTALVVPQYIMFSKFGWLNSFLPILVPAFFAYPYNVFLFRQFYKTIPKSIDESALIDGCNRWGIFTRMIVPLSRSVFVSLGVLSVIFWWNEFFIPLIYLDSDSLKPLTTGAYAIFKNNMVQRWDWQMAFTSMMILPPVIFYILAQKQLTEGIKTSGMKG